MVRFKMNKEKFECLDCGCYYWVEDRNNFSCPNCEDKNNTLIEANKKRGENPQ